MITEEMRNKAIEHLVQIKNSPAEASLNYMRYIDMSENQSLGGDYIFISEDFDWPMLYVSDKWIRMSDGMMEYINILRKYNRVEVV